MDHQQRKKGRHEWDGYNSEWLRIICSTIPTILCFLIAAYLGYQFFSDLNITVTDWFANL